MKIKKINCQHRRDFLADYECEHCGNLKKNQSGYDDSYFHQNIIPKMRCTVCGKSADESYRPLATKHDDSVII